MKDTLTTITTALVAAASTATSAALNLGALTAGRRTPTKLEISLPALPALVDTKSCTIAVTDCDTSGGSYTAVEGLGNMKVTGAGGAGAAAKTWQIYLPPGTRQYVKVTATVESGGGDNTAKSFTVAVVY